MVSLYNSTDHVFLRFLELVSDKNLEEYEAVCRKKHKMHAIRSTQNITLVEIKKPE